jgi:fumarate hydratase subunit beta
MKEIKVASPFEPEIIEQLTSGTRVAVSGTMYVARDAAHRRIVEAIEWRESLPFNIRNQTMYYMGPSPARPGQVIGAAGPTTSARLDVFTLPLLKLGLKVTIGKGERSSEIKQALSKYKAIYMVTYGGAGALLARHVEKVEVVAYEDLGAEAILKIWVNEFPAIVANDIYGGDLFQKERLKFQKA